MSNFGVNISPGEWKVSHPTATPNKPVEFRKQIKQLRDEPLKKSGAFDRACAYLSFFVLVLAAVCIFLPDQVQQFMGWY